MTSAPIAKMFREMIARGVDPEMIALAIETAEATASGGQSVDAMAEKRRAYDRERQRLKRLSTGVSTGGPVDADSALTVLENSSVVKLEKKERAKPSRGETLPPDAKPSVEHYDMALKQGFQQPWVDHQFEDMRIWARTNEHRAVARKSDWDLTFTGWLRRSMNDAKGTNNGTRNLNPQRRSANSDFFAGMSSVAADIAGHDPAPRNADPEVPLGRFNIDG